MAEAKKSTAAKVASPKATVKPPAEEPKTPAEESSAVPEEQPATPNAETPEDEDAAKDAAPDHEAPEPQDSQEVGLADKDEALGDGPNIEAKAPAELVNVIEPCPTCYPEGWFEHEEGIQAACSHLSVIYGTPLVITAELAKELGYKPTGKGEGE